MDTITLPPEVGSPEVVWPPTAAVVEGYDQETVDDFLRAVAEERSRLLRVIDDAHAREARARTLLALHESMLATMLSAYRNVTACRRAAEAAAAAIDRDSAGDHGGNAR
jgi:cell division septum initiation protein DivIVA